jgi:hypothetical protein
MNIELVESIIKQGWLLQELVISWSLSLQLELKFIKKVLINVSIFQVYSACSGLIIEVSNAVCYYLIQFLRLFSILSSFFSSLTSKAVDKMIDTLEHVVTANPGSLNNYQFVYMYSFFLILHLPVSAINRILLQWPIWNSIFPLKFSGVQCWAFAIWATWNFLKFVDVLL